MGMEDRDYYWEDRKRRENKFDKKDTYYRAKEFRRTARGKPGKPPNDWPSSSVLKKDKCKIAFAFMLGAFIAFWVVIAIFLLKPDQLSGAFVMMRKALFLIGFN